MTDTLKLLESEPKKLNWKIVLANSIYSIFKEVKQQDFKVPYGKVMGMITRISESVPSEKNKWKGWAWIDDNGEIQFTIPPIEEFESQFKGFLENEYAKSQKYPIELFFSQYGNYITIEEKYTMPKTHYRCDYCQQMIRLTAREGHRHVCPKFPKEQLF